MDIWDIWDIGETAEGTSNSARIRGWGLSHFSWLQVRARWSEIDRLDAGLTVVTASKLSCQKLSHNDIIWPGWEETLGWTYCWGCILSDLWDPWGRAEDVTLDIYVLLVLNRDKCIGGWFISDIKVKMVPIFNNLSLKKRLNLFFFLYFYIRI